MTESRDSSLQEVAQTLDSEEVGAVVVTDDGGADGIVTDRDVALAVARGADVGATTASDVMAEDPVTIHEDEEAIELSRKIEESNARRIPIVDEEDRLRGIASVDDLVATIGEQLDNVSDTIEAQSPEYSP